VLAALCDILESTPDRAGRHPRRQRRAAPRKTGTGDAATAAELPVELRPRRAHLRPR
jgi:hypothetical protein